MLRSYCRPIQSLCGHGDRHQYLFFQFLRWFQCEAKGESSVLTQESRTSALAFPVPNSYSHRRTLKSKRTTCPPLWVLIPWPVQFELCVLQLHFSSNIHSVNLAEPQVAWHLKYWISKRICGLTGHISSLLAPLVYDTLPPPGCAWLPATIQRSLLSKAASLLIPCPFQSGRPSVTCLSLQWLS